MLWINRALESLWLLTIVLVPLAFLGRSYGEWSSVIGSFELPKIVLLRTLVGLMAAFWLVEWGLSGGFPLRISTNRESWRIRPAVWLSGARNWLRTRPTRWVIVAAAIFLATTLLSTILSASWRVSLWGDVPGQDSYSAYTVAAYVLLFAIIATHLKTSSQMWRLIGAIVLMGVLVAGYAVLQHYGHDFLDLMEPPGKTRTSSTLGNPIFAGSVLLMTIPISLVAVSATIKEPLRTAKFWWKQSLWALVLTVQSMGIIFTLSRGPWFGTILAVAALLIMAGVFVGWRTFARVALAIALAAGLTTVLILLLAHTETEAVSASAVEDVRSRITDLSRGAGGGGVGNRVEIWKGSWQLMTQHPWFEFDDLSLSPLRPIIGYGPELFRSAYFLESPPIGEGLLPHEVAHAHNYFIHQVVELGILGLLSSLGIFVALFLVGSRWLLREWQSLSTIHKLVLIGLLAALGGRLLEQMVGVARVSDLTISWVLLAVFVALPASIHNPDSITNPQGPQRRPRASSRPLARPRSGTVPREPHFQWQFSGRLVLVAFIILGIGSMTWFTRNQLRQGRDDCGRRSGPVPNRRPTSRSDVLGPSH